jgi:hypothetical protein
MVKHDRFLNACVRYLEKKGEAEISDILNGLTTVKGTRMNSRQLPERKGAKCRLTRDKRFERIDYDGRTTCFRLRKRGDE